MAGSSRSSSCPPCVVPRCEPLERYLYFAPGSSKLEACSCSRVPHVPKGCVRVVCISDTHNEHEGLCLPAGDVLIHTGDVLTESGMRHVIRDPILRTIVSVKPDGENLFVNFAVWFGKLEFAHKVLVAGNHDLVLQGLGKPKIQEILTEHCLYGNVVYLENEEATLGTLRVFGSPHANYSSHNDAFRVEDPIYNIRSGVHVIATHMPGVLPNKKKGGVRQHDEIVRPMLEARALLHVSGHCHWANGLYFAVSDDTRVPCVVASVCASSWLHVSQMASWTGYRGDPLDKRYGGYNLVQPGIICDLLLPEVGAGESTLAQYKVPRVPVVDTPADAETEAGAQRSGDRRRRPRSCVPVRHKKLHGDATVSDSAPREPLEKVALLLFCPPNDSDLPPLLIPMLEPVFCVVHVETVADGVRAVSERLFGACIAKLGTKGNLGRDVIAALRSAQGGDPFVAIHSAKAAQSEKTREALDSEFGIGLFTQHGLEPDLIEALSLHFYSHNSQHQAEDEKTWLDSAFDWLNGAPSASAEPPFAHNATLGFKPRVLLFAPSNDPGFAEEMQPQLQDFCDVDVVETAAHGVQAVREHEYKACIAKLGTKGNLGVDIIAAFRGEFGNDPFIAIHSASAAKKPELQQHLTRELGVSLFVQHGQEAELVSALAQALAQMRFHGLE